MAYHYGPTRETVAINAMVVWTVLIYLGLVIYGAGVWF